MKYCVQVFPRKGKTIKSLEKLKIENSWHQGLKTLVNRQLRLSNFNLDNHGQSESLPESASA